MIEQLIQQAQPYWKQYVEHEFVQQLAKGTLPKACFQHYLKQDYIYLFHYSRAFALGVFKAKNFTDMEMPRKTLDILCQEIQLHLDYCRQWKISEQEIFQIPESAACISYTRYLLDCGMTGGLPELYAAVTALCFRLRTSRPLHHRKLSKLPSNPYQAWIDAYSSPEYQQAAQETVDFLTALCEPLNDSQLTNIQQIFTTATRMEIGFWQMGLDLA